MQRLVGLHLKVKGNVGIKKQLNENTGLRTKIRLRRGRWDTRLRALRYAGRSGMREARCGIRFRQKDGDKKVGGYCVRRKRKTGLVSVALLAPIFDCQASDAVEFVGVVCNEDEVSGLCCCGNKKVVRAYRGTF